jgi:hypothetical protein
MVDIATVEPAYSDETVVNKAGTCTMTVPVWPGRDGRAIVDVVVVDPAYSEVTVVNSPVAAGTWMTTVPISPG